MLALSLSHTHTHAANAKIRQKKKVRRLLLLHLYSPGVLILWQPEENVYMSWLLLLNSPEVDYGKGFRSLLSLPPLFCMAAACENAFFPLVLGVLGAAGGEFLFLLSFSQRQTPVRKRDRSLARHSGTSNPPSP